MDGQFDSASGRAAFGYWMGVVRCLLSFVHFGMARACPADRWPGRLMRRTSSSPSVHIAATPLGATDIRARPACNSQGQRLTGGLATDGHMAQKPARPAVPAWGGDISTDTMRSQPRDATSGWRITGSRTHDETVSCSPCTLRMSGGADGL